MSYYANKEEKERLIKEYDEEFVIVDIGSCVEYLEGTLSEALKRMKSYWSEITRKKRYDSVKLTTIKTGLDFLEEIIKDQIKGYRTENKEELDKWEILKH